MQGTLVGSTNNVTSVEDLLAADPSSANPLIGYQIIARPLTASQLVPGQTINTTDTLKQFGAPDRTLAVTVTAPDTVRLSKKSCMDSAHTDGHALQASPSADAPKCGTLSLAYVLA